jgi:hypothetical protein
MTVYRACTDDPDDPKEEEAGFTKEALDTVEHELDYDLELESDDSIPASA